MHLRRNRHMCLGARGKSRCAWVHATLKLCLATTLLRLASAYYNHPLLFTSTLVILSWRGSNGWKAGPGRRAGLRAPGQGSGARRRRRRGWKTVVVSVRAQQ